MPASRLRNRQDSPPSTLSASPAPAASTGQTADTAAASSLSPTQSDSSSPSAAQTALSGTAAGAVPSASAPASATAAVTATATAAAPADSLDDFGIRILLYGFLPLLGLGLLVFLLLLAFRYWRQQNRVSSGSGRRMPAPGSKKLVDIEGSAGEPPVGSGVRIQTSAASSGRDDAQSRFGPADHPPITRLSIAPSSVMDGSVPEYSQWLEPAQSSISSSTPLHGRVFVPPRPSIDIGQAAPPSIPMTTLLPLNGAAAAAPSQQTGGSLRFIRDPISKVIRQVSDDPTPVALTTVVPPDTSSTEAGSRGKNASKKQPPPPPIVTTVSQKPQNLQRGALASRPPVGPRAAEAGTDPKPVGNVAGAKGQLLSPKHYRSESANTLLSTRSELKQDWKLGNMKFQTQEQKLAEREAQEREEQQKRIFQRQQTIVQPPSPFGEPAAVRESVISIVHPQPLSPANVDLGTDGAAHWSPNEVPKTGDQAFSLGNKGLW
ncbi:uncharacterized protein BJ171DRAFT_472447 [Polychytrium aggregatum]|uniref:uncharacterized protein n=1 Tax=Polychytrium aggregatum TaxID=110093 RepID=UPI0022FE9123|nr:uncharacterized protein BJ171DRAFT_472447 [Polychytrium aggregatum]KAI9207577.1 hypothetical protein BJ171DRAFT_472447 [Polychytrium aggregatum]